MLCIVATTLRAASAFIAEHRRHHKPVRGCVCVCAVHDETGLRGVAIVGRPVARRLQDGFTAEVTRCCTDGVKNGCSKLYAACWRAARALGYTRLVTYTLGVNCCHCGAQCGTLTRGEPHQCAACTGTFVVAAGESGLSLAAAGWKCVGAAGGGNWNKPGRHRADTELDGAKLRWEVTTDEREQQA